MTLDNIGELQSRLSPAQLGRLLEVLAPGLEHLHIRHAGPEALICGDRAEGLHARLGGHVSGPSLFQIMDVTAYLAVNWFAGYRPMSVLVSATSDFVTGVEPGPLEVHAMPDHLGFRSAVIRVRVMDGAADVIALSTMRFALQRQRSEAELRSVLGEDELG